MSKKLKPTNRAVNDLFGRPIIPGKWVAYGHRSGDLGKISARRIEALLENDKGQLRIRSSHMCERFLGELRITQKTTTLYNEYQLIVLDKLTSKWLDDIASARGVEL